MYIFDSRNCQIVKISSYPTSINGTQLLANKHFTDKEKKIEFEIMEYKNDAVESQMINSKLV